MQKITDNNIVCCIPKHLGTYFHFFYRLLAHTRGFWKEGRLPTMFISLLDFYRDFSWDYILWMVYLKNTGCWKTKITILSGVSDTTMCEKVEKRAKKVVGTRASTASKLAIIGHGWMGYILILSGFPYQSVALFGPSDCVCDSCFLISFTSW